MIHRSKGRPARGAGALLFIITVLTAPAGLAAAERETLDQFLGRLGLVDLRLHHMQRLLERETDAEKRLAAARKLADAYAEQLVAVADDQAKFDALNVRLDRLLAAEPQAKTPAIEVILLQAEYQRAEALVIRWLDDPADAAPLNEAAGILEAIAPRLVAAQKELLTAAEQAAEEADSLTGEQAQLAAEQQLARQQAVAARAGYFAGWAHYYLGVAKQNRGAGEPHYRSAKEQFARVLDLTDEMDYAPIQAEELGLESIWRSRAVIGLGLAELGLKRAAAAATVFGWLDHASSPPAIRDQAAYWHVQGMLNAGLIAEAAEFVRRQVDSFTSQASPGKNSLCIAAVRRGAAAAGAGAETQQLLEQGLRGLARMRQFETLDTLIEKHKLADAADSGGFTLAWLHGRRQFLAADKAKSPDDYRSAARSLSAALALPGAKLDMADAGQARYYLAWCHYRLDELDVAVRHFQESATALRSSLADLAVQAAWMQCTCLVQLAAKEKKYVTPAVTALQNYKQDYPSSENATRADLLIARLRQTHASPEEAIRSLAAIGPSDPNYSAAQYEIAQLQFQLWNNAKSDPAKAAPLAADVLKTADRFLASTGAGDEQRLKVALLAIDVLHSAEPPDQQRIAALLNGVAPAAASVESTEPAVSEYHYRRLQLAQSAGDETAMREAAHWIATNGRGSPFELPALVIMARGADEAVEAASAADRAARIQEAAEVYGRLVTILGDSPAALAENRNALAAASKLAQYDGELGRLAESADRYQRIVAALPSDRRFLRRAGVACVRAGRHAEALDHWRKLLAGVASGSDQWLEAKYYQLVCLQKTDPPAAAKVWKQFKLLYPELKSEVWSGKFAELEKQFQ